MKPGELELAANAALPGNLTLVFPRGLRLPPGFPRGELLSETEARGRVYSFSAAKVLTWLERNKNALAGEAE